MYDKGIICGSFDLIHPGYVRMFKDAKSVCKLLVVALQGDPTIDRPEKCKPVQSLEDRREILEALRYVDHIETYNTEEDLLRLLQSVPYDVRILGSDYADKKDFTGVELKKPIYYHKRDHSYSTSKLKEMIFEERQEFKRRKNE